MKKTGEQKMKDFLALNQAPEPLPEKAAHLKQEVRLRAESMAFALPQNSSLPDRLLRQLPYISLWIWPIQLLVLLLFFLLLRQKAVGMETLILLSFTGPLLAILPMADIIRSFGCNMWEMESACRYDFRQITAMHLCIIGSGDIFILIFGCCLYGKRLSATWEFSLYIILPFLISSCIYLWELNHFSRKCNIYMLSATGTMLCIIGSSGLQHIYHLIQTGRLQWIPAFTMTAVIAFSTAAVYSAVRLCTNLKRKEGVTKWNLE
ncbi:hypothetical protein NSB25_13995 [Acetatifactor muris]|uniref:ABC-2 family transporter protein n=1 Tax=Acetatifactor muris TaxID=879566 RepID=A0A2K4ZI97_9FIRM|nr:hypothetical protein [Acetatifactor muris]MCR2048402.1 hypothetical protein [Acetatifactor muris]SOY30207.1 hypothetical protein AMURIS_02930 [Acetatifactor muris]